MRKSYIILLPLLLMLIGCETTGSKNPKSTDYPETGLSPENGMLLASVGRENRSFAQLPFISYGVFRVNADDSLEKVAFLPGEAGLINKLGKEKYGYIHFRELPPGEYCLVGQKGRGNGLDSPFGILFVGPAGMIHYDSNGKEVGIVLKFTVEAGKINYIGEVLTTERELTASSIKVSNELERDLSFLHSKLPSLSETDVATHLASKLEKK